MNQVQPDLDFSLLEMDKSFDFSIDQRKLTNKFEWKREVLVIIGNRLGMNEVNRDFFAAIKRYMKLSSFVGLVGGKPRAAYYFCGFVERPTESQQPKIDQLIYLDPHKVRSSDSEKKCFEPKTLEMTELDPCMSFGFHLRSEEEFNAF